MENLNLHKLKLYSLILAGLALIAMFLPWTVQKTVVDFFGGGRRFSMNGFRSVGFLSFLGIIGVVVACLMGDKTRGFDQQSKMISLISFGAIAGGALIYMILVMTKNKAYGASAGFGIFIALLAGLAGLALVSGMVKVPDSVGGPTTPTPRPPSPPPPSV